MDPFLLLLQRQSEDDQEEDLLNTIASILAIVSGVLDHENEHIRRRNPMRLYLTRSQLMPDPRIESPWVRLWEGQNNQGPGHFADLWDNTPIPRDDVSS
ncbi:hypothetical protein DFH05DRAFT_1524574 [Lentinula detonsa]|uniref:Uncharacterized protein n=1 Tax=Lentinula detonsa TaxID=2804962 RepID=A0A9W8P1F2_9AGAR|nr:hypothetical protein DFH05DRAFT_1524574 [Lentinula detonsa]